MKTAEWKKCKVSKKQACAEAGFTLLEILVYSFLFAILSAAFLASAFLSIRAAGQSEKIASIGEEGMFVKRKISWAFVNARDFNIDGQNLLVKNYGNLPDIVFSLEGQNLFLENGDTKQLLSGNVESLFLKKSVLSFAENLSGKFILSGETFVFNESIKKW